MRKLYAFLGYLLLPLVLIDLALKAWRLPAYRQRWQERLGFYNKTVSSGVIWLHACSVGEVETSISLIRKLQERYPTIPCLVTTTTPTGSSRIIDEFGETIQHVYLPFDISFVVNVFLTRFQPRIAIIVEKEIWPNLFFQCDDRNIPLVLASALLSERSLHRYLHWQRLFKPVFQIISRIGAQADLDAKQFNQLGVAAERISVTGSLKFERTVSEQLKRQATQLRQQLFPTRSIWIAASTHDNEEILLLDRLQQLQTNNPYLLLIIAPRHPQRGISIVNYCNQQSISCVTRSSGLSCQSDTRVFLLDTLGELMLFYGVADLAFVGGSLVSVGCHNLLEPAAWGIPMLFGS
ncbi:MAG: 3-deoxy-D-manno-octulosonic acid transferase, partial [Methylococcales bacterium]